ncbi:MAG: TolC family protein [Trueperaceae bacterium]|nr:TolC family protein [Trueperaceae bacterium]
MAAWLTCWAGGQTRLGVTVTERHQAAIDELSRRGWAASSSVIEAELALARSTWALSLEGRLAQALSVTGSASLSGDPYGQATPSAAIHVSLNFMALAGEPDTGERQALAARLAEAKARVRLDVVQATTRLLVARAAAESAAQALETAEAAFRVAEARLALDDVTPGAVLDARLAVSQAAVALLRANAEAVVALEGLAITTGTTADEVATLLGF